MSQLYIMTEPMTYRGLFVAFKQYLLIHLTEIDYTLIQHHAPIQQHLAKLRPPDEY